MTCTLFVKFSHILQNAHKEETELIARLRAKILMSLRVQEELSDRQVDAIISSLRKDLDDSDKVISRVNPKQTNARERATEKTGFQKQQSFCYSRKFQCCFLQEQINDVFAGGIRQLEDSEEYVTTSKILTMALKVGNSFCQRRRQMTTDYGFYSAFGFSSLGSVRV